MLNLHLRTSTLSQNQSGRSYWHQETTKNVVTPTETAIIICNMWDNHWSRGAAERVNAMAPRMNKVLSTARAQGVHIIHAPSDTLDFYADAPARQRILAVELIAPPQAIEHDDPPLPIDDSDHGSDTGEVETFRAWKRQHPAIEIDQTHDYISDSGSQIYGLLQHTQIKQVLLMGVHTNMCILNRSFGIKQMVRWGVNIALIRDLTDAMYNPAMPPYVSHTQGTQLVIDYIEKFWCPTIHSDDLLGIS
ncbi:isochorismatase family protein [Chloroflexi bacterium TSY]|nr:isochorismatase family protein [Chloroflexi bacterium TSY]